MTSRRMSQREVEGYTFLEAFTNSVNLVQLVQKYETPSNPSLCLYWSVFLKMGGCTGKTRLLLVCLCLYLNMTDSNGTTHPYVWACTFVIVRVGVYLCQSEGGRVPLS